MLGLGSKARPRIRAALAAVSLVVATGAHSLAGAAPLELQVQLSLSQSGLAPFDADNSPGNDQNATNNIIRTADVATFRWDWAANEKLVEGSEGTDDLTLVGTLTSGVSAYPQVARWLEIPGVCDGAASAISADGLTLTCEMLDVAHGTTGAIYPQAQINVVPNGTTLTHGLSISGVDSTQVAASPVDLVVSAAPKLNLNAVYKPENITPAAQGRYINPDQPNPALADGWVLAWPVTLEIGGSGRGSEPLQSPQDLHFTLDLAAIRAIYPNASLAPSSVFNANSNISYPNCDQVRTVGRTNVPYGSASSSAFNGSNAAQESGSWSCALSSDGNKVEVTVSGAVTEPTIFPKTNGIGTVQLPVTRKVVASGYVGIFYPWSDIYAVGGPPTSTVTLGTSWSISGAGSDFEPIGISGSDNFGASSEPIADNTTSGAVSYFAPGVYRQDFYNFWAERAGDLGGGFFRAYDLGINPAVHTTYVPTQTQTISAGDGVVFPGQEFTTASTRKYRSSPSGTEYGTQLGVCTTIDPRFLRIVPNAVPIQVMDALTGAPSTTTSDVYSAALPGEASATRVIFTAAGGATVGGPNIPAVPGVDYVVEYGAGSWDTTSNATVWSQMDTYTCRDSEVQDFTGDGIGDWYSDPSTVAGFGWDKATHVRVRVINQSFVQGRAADFGYVAFTNLAVRDVCPLGQIVAADGGYNTDGGWANLALANGAWVTGSDYVPATHSGAGAGDRMTCGTVVPAITKKTVPAQMAPVKPGEVVTFELDWSLDSGPGAVATHSANVVDLLPPSFDFVGFTTSVPELDGSADVTPLFDAAGNTRLVFQFANVPENQQNSITVQARLRTSAPLNATITNEARVSITDTGYTNPALAKRQAFASILTSGTTYSELRIVKNTTVVSTDSAGTGYIGPDGMVEYTLTYENTGVTPLGALTIVDVFPSDGDANDDQSQIDGTFDVAGVVVSRGETCEWATDAVTATEPDPLDPAILALNWTSGACDSPPAGATAVRITAPALPLDDSLTAAVESGPFNIVVSFKATGAFENNLMENSFGVRAAAPSTGSGDLAFGVQSDNLISVNGIDLELDKTLTTTGPIHVGDSVGFAITVCNVDDDVDATGVQVTDELLDASSLAAAGLAFEAADDVAFDISTGVWAVGDVPAGECRTLNVTVKVNERGEFNNAAQVTGANEPEAQPDSAPDSTPDNWDSSTNPVEDDEDKVTFSTVAAIGDTVWFDLDGDGIQSVGETGIEGVTVTLVDADGTFVASMSTGPNGEYLFEDLAPGTYTVQIDASTLPAAVVATFDADGLGTLNQSTVDLGFDDNLDQDFGYEPRGSIGDTIFADANGDGVQDAGDTGISGVTVTIVYLGPDGVPGGGDDETFTAVTDLDGKYLVEDLPLGAYTVTVDTSTLPANTVTNTADPDGLADSTSSLTLSLSARDNLDQDFGYQPFGSIGDTIFFDANGDGVQSADEPGLEGVTVTVTYLGADGVAGGGDDQVFTATTGPDGTYLVGDLPLGAYTVAVDTSTLPAGLTLNTADPDSTHDATSSVALTIADPDNPYQDFGFDGAGSIGDTIWLDLDGDGVQDAGESGIGGVTVNLYDTDGNLVGSVETDADGHWLFNDLLPGTYTVEIDDSTLPPHVTATGDPDGIATLHTSVVELGYGQDLNQDFGYQPLGSIGDTIYYDIDGDGIQSADEPGLEGVTVTITYLGPDGVAGGGDDEVFTVVTSADGSYLVSDLPLGAYSVVVDTTSLPAGMTINTADPDGGADASSVLTLTGTSPNNLDQDFGFQGSGSIGDTVFEDTDGDGQQDAGELGIADVSVTIIWAGPDGDLGTDDDVEYTVTTDSDGHYDLTGLPAGSYSVTIDASTVPAGLSFDSDLDGGFDGTSTLELGVGENRVDVDFGLVSAGPIDLSITKTAVSDSVSAGGSVEWDLVVANVGDNATTSELVVTDALPAGLGFTSAAGEGWDCTADNDVVTCVSDIVLEPAQSSTIRLVTSVDADVDGAITNDASVTHDGEDVAVLSNNISADGIDVVGAPATTTTAKPTTTTTPATTKTASPTSLSVTGATVGGLVLVALVMSMGGMLLIGLNRRRARK